MGIRWEDWLGVGRLRLCSGRLPRVVANHWCVGIGVIVPYAVLRGKLNVIVVGELLKGTLEGGGEGITCVTALLQNGNGRSSLAGGVCLVDGDPRFGMEVGLGHGSAFIFGAQVMC